MRDPSDRPVPTHDDLIVRAVFVPDGEQPPAEFLADIDPLHFRATLDPATGEITCANTGVSIDGDVRARWFPADDGGAFDADEDDNSADLAQETGSPDDFEPDAES